LHLTIDNDLSHTLFETALGTCALAWGRAGIVGLQLPEPSVDETVSRLLLRYPRARPRAADGREAQAISAIANLMATGHGSLHEIEVDMAGLPPFSQTIYKLLRQVLPGQLTTYGELAAKAGDPGAARAVGIAMAKNPYPIIVPCHRVMAAEGKSGGFSGGGGLITKFKLLQIEGSMLI
jgi:methylated-DNA-[protein]-cysteine S-methyltransferase